MFCHVGEQLDVEMSKGAPSVNELGVVRSCRFLYQNACTANISQESSCSKTSFLIFLLRQNGEWGWASHRAVCEVGVREVVSMCSALLTRLSRVPTVEFDLENLLKSGKKFSYFVSNFWVQSCFHFLGFLAGSRCDMLSWIECHGRKHKQLILQVCSWTLENSWNTCQQSRVRTLCSGFAASRCS